MFRRRYIVSLALPLLALLWLLAGACAPVTEVVSPQDLRSTVPGATALVVVYSRSGQTAQVARAFARKLVSVIGVDRKHPAAGETEVDVALRQLGALDAYSL